MQLLKCRAGWRQLRQAGFLSVRRGDTIVEVMFAMAIFALVSIISISMMNAGLASAERSLEVVTARNEINAQAEAIRFIYNSYISELTLAPCDGSVKDVPCQRFAAIWETIMNYTVDPSDIKTDIASCKEDVYDGNYLKNAFVINIRRLEQLRVANGGNVGEVYLQYNSNQNIFTEPPLGARIVYKLEDLGESSDNMNTDEIEVLVPSAYNQIARAEGIWVKAVKNNLNNSYDFYIQTCWYGAGNVRPTTLDTVIRLYIPGELM